MNMVQKKSKSGKKADKSLEAELDKEADEAKNNQQVEKEFTPEIEGKINDFHKKVKDKRHKKK